MLLAFLFLIAKSLIGVEDFKDKLLNFVNTGVLRNNEIIVTNKDITILY